MRILRLIPCRKLYRNITNDKLICNVGQEPAITKLESGKKVARFSLATNEYYKDSKGKKQTYTNWHTVVALGKTAEIVEKFVCKGKEMELNQGHLINDLIVELEKE